MQYATVSPHLQAYFESLGSFFLCFLHNYHRITETVIKLKYKIDFLHLILSNYIDISIFN